MFLSSSSPLLVRFSSSFLRLVEKHRRSRPTKERKIEDVIARDVIRRVRFLVVAQNKGASSSSSSFTKSARAPVSASSSSSRPTRRALLSSKRRGDRHHRRQFYGRPFPVVFASMILKTMMRTQKKGVVVSKRTAGGVFSSTRRDSLCWSASR